MRHIEKQEKFETKNQPDVLSIFGVSDFKSLYELFFNEDQKLLGENIANYTDPELLTTKIKNAVEKINLNELGEEERQQCNNILWLWHHHAAGYELFGRGDIEQAKLNITKALSNKTENNPNKTTFLYHLLVNGKIKAAQKYVDGMEENIEKETSKYLLEQFKKRFLK